MHADNRYSPKVKQNWNKIGDMTIAHAQNQIETKLEQNLNAHALYSLSFDTR